MFQSDYIGKSTRGLNLSDCTNPTNANALTFVTDPHSGATRKVARFEINTTDTLLSGKNRSEVKATSSNQLYDYSTDGWTYRWSIYLPTGYAVDTTQESLFQIHSSPGVGDYQFPSPPFALITNGTKFQVNGRYEPANPATDNGILFTQQLSNWATDTWYNFTLYIQWSATSGNFYLYQNGSLVYSRLSLPNTYDDVQGGYAKQGIYKWDWVDNPGVSQVTQRVMYCDNFSIHKGDTRYLGT